MKKEKQYSSNQDGTYKWLPFIVLDDYEVCFLINETLTKCYAAPLFLEILYMMVYHTKHIGVAC